MLSRKGRAAACARGSFSFSPAGVNYSNINKSLTTITKMFRAHSNMNYSTPFVIYSSHSASDTTLRIFIALLIRFAPHLKIWVSSHKLRVSSHKLWVLHLRSLCNRVQDRTSAAEKDSTPGILHFRFSAPALQMVAPRFNSFPSAAASKRVARTT